MTSSNFEQTSSTPPLVYHYAGKRLPKYALTTLGNAPKRWDGPVVLLNNSAERVDIPGVVDEKFQTWYDGRVFSTMAQSFGMDGNFRDSFWLHAIERFFVLQQWAERGNHEKFLHTELDVVLFGGSSVLSRLDSLRSGLFLPRASSLQAGADWLYVNERGSLGALIQYFQLHAGEGFEMQLLGRFLEEMPEFVFSVPSHQAFESHDSVTPMTNALSFDQVRGVVDIHPLGTWMFGQDRRNIPKQPVFNRFYFEDVGSPIMECLRFRYSWKLKSLVVRDSRKTSAEWPVLALHVHSKVMGRAHAPMMLSLHAWLANRKFRTIVIPQSTLRYFSARAKGSLDRVYLFLRMDKLRKLWAIR